MPETNGFSKDGFAMFQKCLSELSPEEHARVINDLIEQLYQYIHDFAMRLEKPNPLQTTVVANSYVRALMEDYEKNVVGPFLKARAFPQYLKYLQQGIAWFVSNKIDLEDRDFPFVQPPIDANTEQEIDFPDNYQPEEISLELANKLIDVLYSTLNEDQRQLLEMRLGIRFVEKDGKVEVVSAQKMTFSEIAEVLGSGQSANTVAKRFARLIEKIRESHAIVLFYRDFKD